MEDTMKRIEVVAAVIRAGDMIFATQRGYGEFKDRWEFPGGKVEPGEDRIHALRREIKEELDTEVSVDSFLCTVDYDYPSFHITLHCYICSAESGSLVLKEHMSARWLSVDSLRSVDWLPADLEVISIIEDVMQKGVRGQKEGEASRRLSQIVDFCRLIDKEKFIERRTYLTDGQRLENDAEHAWHLAVMAILLSEYSSEKIDLLKVVSIVLIHDLVEIYAGDTFAYDTEGLKTQKERETAAADRLFGLLPEDLAVKFRGLWDEFEEGVSPEARFAHTLDNFQPLMLQAATDGKAWREGGRRLGEVLRRNAHTAEGSPSLWNYAVENFIRPQIDRGHLRDDLSINEKSTEDKVGF